MADLDTLKEDIKEQTRFEGELSDEATHLLMLKYLISIDHLLKEQKSNRRNNFNKRGFKKNFRSGNFKKDR